MVHQQLLRGNGNSCIEVAFLPDGTVAVRDTKDRTRPAHRYTTAAWDAFLTATRVGRRQARQAARLGRDRSGVRSTRSSVPVEECVGDQVEDVQTILDDLPDITTEES